MAHPADAACHAGTAAVALRPWAPWWRAPGVLQRLVSDLIGDEVARLRPGGSGLPALPWPADLPLGTDATGRGLGLDSLERLSVASALTEALHLHESGIEDLLLVQATLGEWLALADEGLCHFSDRLSFRTSGSSGEPKRCTHALADLQQEVDHLAGLLAGRSAVRAAVPAHHIYGFLFTVLLPARLGCAPADDLRRVTPTSLPRRLRPGDLLVSHPSHWALVARHAPALPVGVHGVSSTAPCPDTLAQALAQRGLQRLVQVYGSSETAGIGWRDAPGAPFRLMPHWQRSDAGRPTLPRNDADAEADARAHPALLRRHAADGHVRRHALPDRLDWLDDGSFRVAGRRDAAVQVGGVNVFPEQVRRLLLRHPQVADAAVRLMQPAEGERLKAFIVPAAAAALAEDGHAALCHELSAWLAGQVGAPSQPKAWRFGPCLPTNGLGKACDWALS